MKRKVNVGLAIAKNFNKVTFEILDEEVEYKDEIDFEAKIKQLFNTVRGQVAVELRKIKEIR